MDRSSCSTMTVRCPTRSRGRGECDRSRVAGQGARETERKTAAGPALRKGGAREPGAKPDRTRAEPDAEGSGMAEARTRLRVPSGNKEAAQQLGARYLAGGWYAPPGIVLAPFRQRGWL